MKINFIFVSMIMILNSAGQAFAAQADEDLYYELMRYDGAYDGTSHGEGEQTAGRTDTIIASVSAVSCSKLDDEIRRACWLRKNGSHSEKLQLRGDAPSGLKNALMNWSQEKYGQKLDSTRAILAYLVTCKAMVTYLDEAGFHQKKRYECSLGGIANQ